MIQVFKPCIGQEEIESVKQVLKSGWLGLGPKTAEFEEKFSEFIGVRGTIGLNSATASLDLALKLLRIDHDDEVIVPTTTFVSTAHAVIYNNAVPIFADTDYKSLSFDLNDVAKKISKKTKAIIPVHYGGRPVDMDRLKDIAGNIPIIEDCAHASGAKYKGQRAGSIGEMGCFSFQAVKNLTMGDGGALTTWNMDFIQRAKRMRWLGIDKGTWDRTESDRSYWWKYQVDEIGLKCHMNDILAAIGIVQLKKLEKMNARRKEIAISYFNGLRDIKQVELPLDDDSEYQSSWHIFCVKAHQRDELGAYLGHNNIATGVHYTPIHTYKCYGSQPALPVAEKLETRIVSLPMYPDMTDEEVAWIIRCIKAFYR